MDVFRVKGGGDELSLGECGHDFPSAIVIKTKKRLN